eukprot:Opistho-2@27267
MLDLVCIAGTRDHLAGEREGLESGNFLLELHVGLVVPHNLHYLRPQQQRRLAPRVLYDLHRLQHPLLLKIRRKHVKVRVSAVQTPLAGGQQVHVDIRSKQKLRLRVDRLWIARRHRIFPAHNQVSREGYCRGRGRLCLLLNLCAAAVAVARSPRILVTIVAVVISTIVVVISTVVVVVVVRRSPCIPLRSIPILHLFILVPNGRARRDPLARTPSTVLLSLPLSLFVSTPTSVVRRQSRRRLHRFPRTRRVYSRADILGGARLLGLLHALVVLDDRRLRIIHAAKKSIAHSRRRQRIRPERRPRVHAACLLIGNVLVRCEILDGLCDDHTVDINHLAHITREVRLEHAPRNLKVPRNAVLDAIALLPPPLRPRPNGRELLCPRCRAHGKWLSRD